MPAARVADGEHGVAVAARERQLDLPAAGVYFTAFFDEGSAPRDGGRTASPIDARRPIVSSRTATWPLGQSGVDLAKFPRPEVASVENRHSWLPPASSATAVSRSSDRANQPLHLLEARAEDPAVLSGRPLRPERDLDASSEGR